MPRRSLWVGLKTNAVNDHTESLSSSSDEDPVEPLPKRARPARPSPDPSTDRSPDKDLSSAPPRGASPVRFSNPSSGGVGGSETPAQGDIEIIETSPADGNLHTDQTSAPQEWADM